MFERFNAVVLYITPLSVLPNASGKMPVFQYCFQPEIHDKLFGSTLPKPIISQAEQEHTDDESIAAMGQGCTMYSYTNRDDNLKYWVVCLKDNLDHDNSSCGFFELEPIECLQKLNDVIDLYFNSFDMDIKQTTTTISSALNSASAGVIQARSTFMGSGNEASRSRLQEFGNHGRDESNSGNLGMGSVSYGASKVDKVLNIRRVIKDCDRIVLIIQVCEQMNGTEDFNRLVEVIPYRKTISNFINETTKSLSNVKLTSSKTNNLKILRFDEINRENRAVPWRSSSSKYINDEIYVDVVEEISMVVELVHKKAKKSKNKNKSYYGVTQGNNDDIKVVFENVNGKIDVDSQLSHDSPKLELQLSVNDNETIQKSYHQCIQANDKDNDNYNAQNFLRFIPPDGKFTLMKYHIFGQSNVTTTKTSKSQIIKQKKRKIPIELDYEKNLGIEQDQFEIKLNVGNNMMKIEEISDLKIKIFFSDHKDISKDELKVINSTHGYIERKSIEQGGNCQFPYYEWVFPIDELKRLIMGSLVSIRLYTLMNKFPFRLSMSYTISGGNLQYNNLQIQKLNLINDAANLKPFKGVKYTISLKDYILNL